MLESLAHFAMSCGDLAFLVPTQPGPEWNIPCQTRNLASTLDGLILQGGADVSPMNYGEEPADPEWQGDPKRDAYEMALIRAFLEAGKPIFGICRGMQLLNVTLGGSLHQDLPTQFASPICHCDLSLNPGIVHPVEFSHGGVFERCYRSQGLNQGSVVSIHHQGVKRLAPCLRVEALSPDGLIEAFSLNDENHYCVGVQWHPEIQPPGSREYLDARPLLEEFRRHMGLARQGDCTLNSAA